LGDLWPPKTLQLNFGFGSVTNKNLDKNTPCQIEEYISKRLLTGTKPTYNEHKKTQEKVFVGCNAGGYNFTFFFFAPLPKTSHVRFVPVSDHLGNALLFHD
jgi:hypothetical protein